ncbi:MAG TPA: papain-like cysteine protease family protein [Roseomonas sp.]|jgi:hypothetical protein
MGIYLDVPFANQLMRPGQNSVFHDPTGCWYASANMIGWYFEAGPRLGVPELHSSSLPQEIRSRLGLQGHLATGSREARAVMNAYHGGQSEHVLLAEREHLEPVEHCTRQNYNFGGLQIETILRRHGPIFFYWTKVARGLRYGHASVLIGIGKRNAEVIYHDPENAPNSAMPLDAFNQLRQRWQYALMRRSGAGHVIRGRSIA